MPNRPLGAVLNRLRTVLEPEWEGATDRELLRRFVARREEGAFSELVRRHGPMVLGVCRRILGDVHAADDAFQATFLVLVRRARAVPWRVSLGGWLHGTARRVALRAAGERRGVSPPVAHRRAYATPLLENDPSEQAAAAELRRVLDQELQGLPAKYRAPLVLCDLEGMTHEQAARELGWPKGSLSKRLTGGRERLRQRLVRRGVGLSAAVAAVLTAKAATASVPAALAAAAMLAAEGGASTTVAVLAKGVMRMMGLTRLRTAAVLALTLAVAGTMAGVGVYRAWGARSAAPAAAPPSPAPAEVKDKDTAVIPVDKAIVYHIGPDQDKEQFQALAEGAVLTAERPESAGDNAGLYLSLFDGIYRQTRAVPVGSHQAILVVGPVLDSPDDAAFVGLTRHGDDLEMTLARTSAAAEGKELSKNRIWRPLVQAPVNLPVGRYRLKVTWQIRKSLPGGALTESKSGWYRAFLVSGAERKESKPERVNGADFIAFAESPVRAPAVGEERPVDVGLRIVNRTDKPLEFYSVSPAARLQLLTADGKEAPGTFTPTSPGYLVPGTVTLPHNKAMSPPMEATLRWSADAKRLQLHITNQEDFIQDYDDIKPGKYLLTAEYQLDKSPNPTEPFWTGMAKTAPVEFEITGP